MLFDPAHGTPASLNHTNRMLSHQSAVQFELAF